MTAAPRPRSVDVKASLVERREHRLPDDVHPPLGTVDTLTVGVLPDVPANRTQDRRAEGDLAAMRGQAPAHQGRADERPHPRDRPMAGTCESITSTVPMSPADQATTPGR